jgi:hypothetical protein
MDPANPEPTAVEAMLDLAMYACTYVAAQAELDIQEGRLPPNAFVVVRVLPVWCDEPALAVWSAIEVAN